MATIIRNAALVNDGKTIYTDILIRKERIERIDSSFDVKFKAEEVAADGLFIIPGIIDAQVHFRDPGLTHKADIQSESRAAVAGGVTSFIDMPNTKPNTLSIELLEQKYEIAARKSLANFGFLLGVNAENLDYVLQQDTSNLLGVTDDGLYFSGKGNLLADNPQVLEKLFSGCSALIAIHSEKEKIIEENESRFREKYGEDIPVELHPQIRSEEACFLATQEAVKLAQRYGARLHILHLSTARETALFDNTLPLGEKKITTEVSVHHLWFDEKDYARLGKKIKWNPAIKTAADKEGLFQALLDDKIDIVTTDHAPHTWEEKNRPYFQSMSGAPIIQHSLNIMLSFYHAGKISLEKIVGKMCHSPAVLYRLKDRGFAYEGYYADLAMIDLSRIWKVTAENTFYKCGWSPLEGETFTGKVVKTLVNGHLVYNNGTFFEIPVGKPLRPVGN
ncbi:MAG: dihydroorotase [Chitinophagales bacterium]|nr:dihydroorotase [Chitinophagales bacterium]MDW8273157.1 dihydroorotase [Chitinophagales bacterium]